MCRRLTGVNLKNALFVEHPKGVIRYYRIAREQARLFRAFDKLTDDKKRLETYLKRGLVLNERTKKILKHNDFKDFRSAVDFHIEQALLGTVLPFRCGGALAKGLSYKSVISLIHKLRFVSYYPRIIEQILEPLAARELAKSGITAKHAARFMTLQEILRHKKVDVAARIKQSRQGLLSIYENHEGREKLRWVKDSGPLVRSLEKADLSAKEVKGNIACRGLVRGTARLILTTKFSAAAFHKGDILVAISTSPELMPLIRKCGAIVTDEGGLTCHAAIISRELNIPCIIGTKVATQVLREGDQVEVNANQGKVRIIR